jgi:hypothetical protein
LIRRGLVDGSLNKTYSSRELTMGVYGMMTIKVMEHLLHGKPCLTRRDAESIVQLFLGGAAAHR